jgi:YVTN family beta-propeller protein
VCLLFLLGMALLAIPTQAQTRAYVTNLNSNSVSVIDTASNTVVATVGVGSVPYWVAITPDGTRAYVTNFGSNFVSVIDTASNTVVATVGVGSEPFGVAITPGVG